MTEQEMMQEALKWQEHIRKLVTATDDEMYHKRSKVFDWLIKQAYRVQKLEKDLDEALDIGLKMEGEANEWERKAKRYKQALEEIIRQHELEDEIDDYDFMWNVKQIARQALKGETK